MYKRKPENLKELVSYNLIRILRKKLKKSNFCVLDMTTKQRELFFKKVEEFFREGKLQYNPFENKQRILLIFLEEDKEWNIES